MVDSSETRDFGSGTKEKVRELSPKVREQPKKVRRKVRRGEIFSSERILDLIKDKPTISAAEIAMEIDMSARGVEKQIRKL